MTEAEAWIKRALKNNPDLVSVNLDWAYLVDGESARQVGQKSRWQNEDQFMRSVFKHFDLRSWQDIRWGLIYHIPNENSHHRPGVRGGVLDLCLPVPMRGYGACYIELKIYGGAVDNNQIVWIERLRNAGNFAEVVWEDQDKVLGIFEWYLGG